MHVRWTDGGDVILTIWSSPGYRYLGEADCADFDRQQTSQVSYFAPGARY